MFDVRDEIINLSKKGTFPYNDKISKTEEKKKESEEELDEKFFLKDIENKSEGINYELFEKYFNFSAPTVLAKKII